MSIRWLPGTRLPALLRRLDPGLSGRRLATALACPGYSRNAGHCILCAPGNEVLCFEVQVTGVTRDGGYQEFMLASAHYVAPIPEALDFAEAVPY